MVPEAGENGPTPEARAEKNPGWQRQNLSRLLRWVRVIPGPKAHWMKLVDERGDARNKQKKRAASSGRLVPVATWSHVLPSKSRERSCMRMKLRWPKRAFCDEGRSARWLPFSSGSLVSEYRTVPSYCLLPRKPLSLPLLFERLHTMPPSPPLFHRIYPKTAYPRGLI